MGDAKSVTSGRNSNIPTRITDGVDFMGVELKKRGFNKEEEE